MGWGNGQRGIVSENTLGDKWTIQIWGSLEESRVNGDRWIPLPWRPEGNLLKKYGSTNPANSSLFTG